MVEGVGSRMMTNVAHKRKKSPEAVKHALIRSTIELVARGGLQPVLASCGGSCVTKGGLFHHFESRSALLEVVCRFLLDEFASRLQHYVDADPCVQVVIQGVIFGLSWI